MIVPEEYFLLLTQYINDLGPDNYLMEEISQYMEERLKEDDGTDNFAYKLSALTQLIKENLIAKNEFEYWKELYEKIDEKNIPAKDKKIIQTVFDAELEDEKEQTI